jgi:hypothetical protein
MEGEANYFRFLIGAYVGLYAFDDLYLHSGSFFAPFLYEPISHY